MKVRLASIDKRRPSTAPAEMLTAEYLKRTTRFNPIEASDFADEESLLRSLDKGSRTAPVLVALDSRGKLLTSEELAAFVQQHLERGTQELVFAIGPANGWSRTTLERAQATISLGRITLPHELARVVLAEQIYRAFTILNRHPYHSGH